METRNHLKNGAYKKLKQQIMKKLLTIIIIAGMTTFLACGPSAKDKAEIQKKLLDSIKKADSVKSLTEEIPGTFIDQRDNKRYKIVTIGTQTWMAENLAYKANSGCWAYNNDIKNVKVYGYLYNWETAKKSNPQGWHLPTDTEWKKMIDYLGGENVAGGKMMVTGTSFWKGTNKPTNSSGFSALPTGYMSIYNDFRDLGMSCCWLSSTEYAPNLAWGYSLYNNYNGAEHGYYSKEGGSPVRYLKDN